MQHSGKRVGPLQKTTHELWYAWVGLFLLASLFRLTGPAWDGGIAAHPDERFLLGVGHQVRLVENICAAVPDYAYGHLPFALLRLLVLIAPDADPLYAARLLSGLIGVLIVALAGRCAKEILGSRDNEVLSLLAGAVACTAPFLIQQSHFFTVDPLGTVLASGALLAGCRRRWRTAGVLTGLAVATKLSLILTAVVLVAWAYWCEHAAARDVQASRRRRHGVPVAPLRVSLFAILGFALVSPWSFITPVACWRGPVIQGLMAGGRLDFPYTRQYAGTLPWIYPLEQMALWGLGPAATAMGLVGILMTLRPYSSQHGAGRAALSLPWVWTVLAFLVLGGLKVKFPRYLLPIYPWWAGWAAAAFGRLSRRVGVLAWSVLLAVTLGGTAFLGVAQAALYSRPHPWVEASDWIYRRVQPGARLAVEAWDHPLPVPRPGGDPTDYGQLTLPVYDPEGPEKMATLQAIVADVDAVILASRRGYAANPSPSTLTWYRGLLRAQQIHVFARCPTLGPLAITDDPFADAGLPVGVTLAKRCGTRYVLRLPALDESFRVYDAPMTLVMDRR